MVHLQYIQAMYHHSKPSTGRKPWRGIAATVKYHPTFDFFGNAKESADRAETPEKDTFRTIGNDRQPELVSPKRGTSSQEG
jgi:hypothetical protein